MLKFYFFNVGHGDSIAINFPDGEWGIIDCNRNKNEINPQVLNFLVRSSVKELNFICVTHPHTDHFNGLDKIIEHYKGHIGKFIIYGLTKNDKEISQNNSLGRGLIKFIEDNSHNIKEKLILITRGDLFKVGDVEITCLNPTNEILNRLRVQEILPASNIEYNNSSVVLKIKYNTHVTLLTGDSTSDNWSEIQKSFNCKPNVIKISHHGSKSNNLAILPKILNKETLTVISTDGGIRYKSLPSPEVIECINNTCVNKVLTTSDLSQITIDVGNSSLNITQNDLLEAVIDEATQNYPVTRYDGFIQFTISEAGKITKNSYNTINNYFQL